MDCEARFWMEKYKAMKEVAHEAKNFAEGCIGNDDSEVLTNIQGQLDMIEDSVTEYTMR